jgi:hypothetical protein
MDDQHIYHHNANDGPRVNVKAEKNSRGVNYEATVIGAHSPEEAMALLRETVAALEKEFGKS